MKTKYPVEAFALAMVLCTVKTANALVIGCLLIFGTLVGMLARVIIGEEKRMQEVEIMITFFAVFGSIYLVNNVVYQQEDNWQSMFAIAGIGLLAAKFVLQADKDLCRDYMTVIKRGGSAYIAMIVIAVFREILGKGTFLGYTVLTHGMVATGYSHTFFGLIMAGFGVAAINRLFDTDAADLDSTLIVIPAAVLAAPFTLSGVPDVFSILVALLLVIIYLVSVKGRLIFSDTQKFFTGMPIELIAVGIVYMILSFF